MRIVIVEVCANFLNFCLWDDSDCVLSFKMISHCENLNIQCWNLILLLVVSWKCTSNLFALSSSSFFFLKFIVVMLYPNIHVLDLIYLEIPCVLSSLCMSVYSYLYF